VRLRAAPARHADPHYARRGTERLASPCCAPCQLCLACCRESPPGLNPTGAETDLGNAHQRASRSFLLTRPCCREQASATRTTPLLTPARATLQPPFPVRAGNLRCCPPAPLLCRIGRRVTATRSPSPGKPEPPTPVRWPRRSPSTRLPVRSPPPGPRCSSSLFCALNVRGVCY
jgi:hypothetical protein